jgi:hypothetical protein
LKSAFFGKDSALSTTQQTCWCSGAVRFHHAPAFPGKTKQPGNGSNFERTEKREREQQQQQQQQQRGGGVEGEDKIRPKRQVVILGCNVGLGHPSIDMGQETGDRRQETRRKRQESRKTGE